MNNNAKPNNPDDALFGNSADDLADDLNNDIDVPVYRRDAQKPADSTAPAKATKIDKPGKETADAAEKSATEAAQDKANGSTDTKANSTADAAADATTAESAADATTAESADTLETDKPQTEAPAKEKPAKRDIYTVLGRARPQRIESRRPEPEVDLSKLEASQSAAGANAGEANDPSDRWGKVDDANPAERATAPSNDQAFSRQAKNSAAAGAAGAGGADASADTTSNADTAAESTEVAEAAEAGVVDADRSSAGAGVADAGAGDPGVASAGAAGAGAAGVGVGAGVAGTAVAAGNGNGKAPGAGETAGVGETAGAGTASGTDTASSTDKASGTDTSTDAAGTGAVGVAAEVKRGTTSFGQLILRAVLGVYLLVRGLQTLFAFGGDPGVEAFQSQLGNYNFTDILAIGIPIAEVVAGGLLLLGLVTPFGAALATIIGGFMAFHNLDSFQGTLWPYGLNPYVQLWAALTVASISLIFLGPGRISLDRSRGWATRPLASAWIFFVVAAAATAGLWLGVGGGNPFN
ncbi:DoxX family protein [uncultured Corynebacterium sp.]|uniref:DoxX family protein n=1 Tax=uncultured Corynebacterium sp. TaxID=159447 RepID=UPI0025EA4D16|nr:DoxX family protein [uncultured Corynebacterium sp.]